MLCTAFEAGQADHATWIGLEVGVELIRLSGFSPRAYTLWPRPFPVIQQIRNYAQGNLIMFVLSSSSQEIRSGAHTAQCRAAARRPACAALPPSCYVFLASLMYIFVHSLLSLACMLVAYICGMNDQWTMKYGLQSDLEPCIVDVP